MTPLGPVLAGTQILVTAQRRAGDLSLALGRRGATVTTAASLGVESHIDEETLLAQTRQMIATRADIVVVTTGIGFRSWLDTAETAGLGHDLVEALRGTRLIARGPKARGAIQAAGLVPDWVAESETSAEIADFLVTEGVHQAIDLSLRMLVDPHDTVWVEEPGYWGFHKVLQMDAARVRPLQVETADNGPGAGWPRGGKAPRLIFVTPSHQYPLGAVMSLARRRELLDQARAVGGWIVEDDYDSEFRFAGRPIPAMQGLEADSPVIYIGTFSKTLCPGLRVGYMVLPRALAPAFRTAHADLYREGHAITQQALAELITEGHYAAHIRRMRVLYARRRALLVGLITEHLGSEFLHPQASNAGLHLVLRLPDGCDDAAIAAAAQAQGVLTRPLSAYYQRSGPCRGLLLGYACVQEAHIAPAFEVLLECLRHIGAPATVRGPFRTMRRGVR